ncbi:MAG TPA: hypothetical protein VMR45_01705 [Patescibacteria group bacterium]|nr:hypothetical protein [Patescibacteria group bacterium]
MKHPITQTSNGLAVYVDLVRSPAGLHIAEQPYILGFIRETLEQAKLEDQVVRIEQDMGRNIGYDYVTKTGDSDTVFYARLIRDETYTRFVKNGKPQPTHFLTMILKRDDDGAYELRDAWVGHMCPPRPGSDDENHESKLYWEGHAHVFDRQPLQSRTITRVCPY